MPVINFNVADKVILNGITGDRAFIGDELLWEAVKGRLFYDSTSGNPFDPDGLKKDEKVIVIPKKDFPLDLIKKEENPYGIYPDKIKYSYDIAMLDLHFPFGIRTQSIEISLIKDKNQPFSPTNDIWRLYNPFGFAKQNGYEVTNIKFVADWIDKIYIVEE